MKKISIALVALISSSAFAAKAQTSSYERTPSYKAETSIVAEATSITSSGVFSDAILKKATKATAPKFLSVEAVGGMAGIGFAGY